MLQADGLFTPAEVARLFHVDPKTVTRWAKSGKLPCIRTLGGHRRYRAEVVVGLLREGSQGASWSTISEIVEAALAAPSNGSRRTPTRTAEEFIPEPAGELLTPQRV